MNKPAQTIEDLWQIYAAAVGVPMGGVQWRETRRAFYAGCSELLAQLRRMPDDEAAGVVRLEAWTQETVKFYERVKKGDA